MTLYQAASHGVSWELKTVIPMGPPRPACFTGEGL
jgi:hypothetical protein